jgi:virulence factor
MTPEESGAPSPFRVAFIGAGTFANQFHYASLSRMPDVQIVAIAELDEARLQKTAEKYNVPGRYTDYRRMLSEVEADAVYVIMNPQYLLPIALDVIRAGKNIFTEKPAGVDASEARQLAEAAARYGVKSGVGTNRRYSAVLRKAREEVEKHGPISTVVAEFHKDMTEPYFNENILYFDGLHVVDPMRWMLGEAVSVHSHADHWYSRKGWDKSYNVYQALIRFDSGGSGLFTANRQAGARYERFEIHGDGVSAYVRAPERVEVYQAGVKEPDVWTGEQLVDSAENLMTYGYFTENREFVNNVRAGRDGETNFAEHLKTLELCERIHNGEHVERLRGNA